MSDILGGPIGPITFTALSTRSINIQIEKGSQAGPYQNFLIQRENWDYICKIPVHGVLTDCTDSHARQGNNNYHIGANYPSVSWSPEDHYGETLQQDRKYYFKYSYLLAL